MFRNAFQGGLSVEVLNPSNKDLLSSWFISKHVKKEFDKTAKTFTYFLKGESTAQHMFIPKDKKMSLGLLQYYLVIQIYVSVDQRFSLDVRITCKSGCHKRITFSSHKEKVQLTPLFASVPLQVCHKNRWVHLCINLADVTSELWHEEYKCIGSISLSGNCSIRQIYTISENLIEQADCRSWEDRYRQNLPRRHHFPVNIVQGSQLISKTYISRCMKSTSSKESSTSGSLKSLPATSTQSKREILCSSAPSGKTSEPSIGQASLKPSLMKPFTTAHSVEGGRNFSRPASCSSQRNAPSKARVMVASEPAEVNSCSNMPGINREENTLSGISISNAHSCVPENLPTSIKNPPSSCSSRSISPSGSESDSRGIADLLPRYKNHDFWMPQLSPVSNALSLARAITKSRDIENYCDENSTGKSISETWGEYQENKGSGSNIYNDSIVSLCKEHQKLLNENVEYEQGTLCSLHQRLRENDIQTAGSSSQIASGQNDTAQNSGLFSAVYENVHSNVDFNSTRTLYDDNCGGSLSDKEDEDADLDSHACTAFGMLPLTTKLNKTFTL